VFCLENGNVEWMDSGLQHCKILSIGYSIIDNSAILLHFIYDDNQSQESPLTINMLKIKKIKFKSLTMI